MAVRRSITASGSTGPRAALHGSFMDSGSPRPPLAASVALAGALDGRRRSCPGVSSQRASRRTSSASTRRDCPGAWSSWLTGRRAVAGGDPHLSARCRRRARRCVASGDFRETERLAALERRQFLASRRRRNGGRRRRGHRRRARARALVRPLAATGRARSSSPWSRTRRRTRCRAWQGAPASAPTGRLGRTGATVSDVGARHRRDPGRERRGRSRATRSSAASPTSTPRPTTPALAPRRRWAAP